MKKLFTVVAVIALVCNAAQAKTWRINNDPEAKADFLSINDAMASLDVFDGDVLYLDPGCRLPSQTVSKSVTIIGTGYNLTESEEAMVDGITLKVEGIKLTGVNVSGEIACSKNNIIVERCKSQGISVYPDLLGIQIIGCYIHGKITCRSITDKYQAVVRNCIVLGQISYMDNGIISNNVVIQDSGSSTNFNSYPLTAIDNSTISNNIIINTTTHTSVTDNVVTYYRNNTIASITVENNNNIINK